MEEDVEGRVGVVGDAERESIVCVGVEGGMKRGRVNILAALSDKCDCSPRRRGRRRRGVGGSSKRDAIPSRAGRRKKRKKETERQRKTSLKPVLVPGVPEYDVDEHYRKAADEDVCEGAGAVAGKHARLSQPVGWSRCRVCGGGWEAFEAQ